MNNEMERLLQEQREQIALLQQAAERETDRANRAEQAARDARLQVEQAERDRERVERAARLQAEREERLRNGTYFSPIDDILKKVDIDIQNHSFNYSFVRHHHVVSNDNDHRYEETVVAATKQNTRVATDQTPIVATEQNAEAATGNRNEQKSDERGEDAERPNIGMSSTSGSSRSKPTDDPVDIFGNSSPGAHSAHLLPNSPSCSPYWFILVTFVLLTGEVATLLWDFMQNCIHGTNDSTGKKIPHVGIKHFPTNRIRLIGQAVHLDKYPCVIIVPILTLEQVRDWNGGKYDAIVLAGDWSYKIRKGKETKSVSAAQVYLEIVVTGNLRENDNFADDLAKKDQFKIACDVLGHFIICLCQAFNVTATTGLHENLEKGIKTKDNFPKWKSNFPIETVPVPVSNDWNDDTMKVRKVSFADSKEKENPAPDPVLLLAKAASNWLKRHEIEILPGCGDGDSSTSHSEEESAQRYSHAAKKPCVVEFNINVNRDDVEEPLSDDEFLLDA